MAYNETITQRVRVALAGVKQVEEKKMMGGLTFMVHGKMCVGVVEDDLMVRLDPTVYESALEQKGCREMNFTGKPMRGFVFVGPEGLATKKDLSHWIELALEFNTLAKASPKKKMK